MSRFCSEIFFENLILSDCAAPKAGFPQESKEISDFINGGFDFDQALSRYKERNLNRSTMSALQHSIKNAAKRSGLSPHVIRIWEKRYQAVTPARTPTKRRLYSEADLERLTLLRHATHSGHSIGNIARLSCDQLRELVGVNRAAPLSPVLHSQSAEKFVEDGLAAIHNLDALTLEQVLDRAVVAFGQHGLLQKVIAPLTTATGDLWRSGGLSAAHEHLATAVVRVFLGKLSRPFAVNGIAPRIVVTTPAGQYHELGALMVSAAATDMGWQTTYLGASLPAAEIAGAAIQNYARAVALSLVYPEDDPALPAELQHLRRYLPQDMPILVGGRAAPPYAAALEAIGALRCDGLGELYSHLEALRSAPPPLPGE